MPMYDEFLLARRHPAQDQMRRPRPKHISARRDPRRRHVTTRRLAQTSASWR
jgi:hypothetical protein